MIDLRLYHNFCDNRVAVANVGILLLFTYAKTEYF